MGRPIILSEDAFYEKLITHRRGGFCYELNGSFAALLTSLGFKVRMLSARVARKDGGFTPEFDHMTLLVAMKGRWLADVGFGESFTEPKRLDFEGPQPDNGRVYRITRRAGGRLLSRWDGEKNLWEPQYLFSLRRRSLGDFVVYSADTGWKSDSDRFEAYCNERRQANRAACQGSTRVR